MKWAIQSKPDIAQTIEDLRVLNELGYETTEFTVIPFTHEIPELPEVLKASIVRGSTFAIEALSKIGHNGVFYNDEFRFTEWLRNLPQEWFLNNRFKELSYEEFCNFDIKSDKHGKDYFIRPNYDLKSFPGQVVDFTDVDVEGFISHLQRVGCDLDRAGSFILADVKHIRAEYRAVIVDPFYWISQYKSETKEDLKIPEHVGDLVDSVLNYWLPHSVCILDIAIDVNDDAKILEFNCFNASGFYKSHPRDEIFKQLTKYAERNLVLTI